MIVEHTEKMRWRVVTDMGTIETVAVSAAKAKGNARFRLVMSDRAYKQPQPCDYAAMRDIEVMKCERLGPVGARGFFYGGKVHAMRKRIASCSSLAGRSAETPGGDRF